MREIDYNNYFWQDEEIRLRALNQKIGKGITRQLFPSALRGQLDINI